MKKSQELADQQYELDANALNIGLDLVSLTNQGKWDLIDIDSSSTTNDVSVVLIDIRLITVRILFFNSWLQYCWNSAGK